MSDKTSLHILCFGEALWDCFPGGRHIGGAPVNVAYHLTKLGSTAWPVSAVGDDTLGREMLDRLQSWGLRCELIGRRTDKPTGIVDVTLSNGSASYEIAEDVAWDYIDAPAPLKGDCANADAIIYGSLSQRSAHNRESLGRFLDLAPGALRVFDVNLRPPHFEPDHVRSLLQHADLIKLNDEEILSLFGDSADSADLEQLARSVAEQTHCARICVTAGSSGAGLLDSDSWLWVESKPIEVRDTVGAGDSFLAALVHGLLTTPEQPRRNLERASRLAGFVASSDGATPEYSVEDLL